MCSDYMPYLIAPTLYDELSLYIYIYHESSTRNVGIIKQQERQCITYNVTLRRVRATIVDKKSNSYYKVVQI